MKKIIANPETKLTVDNMKTLLGNHRLKNDSPMKSKVNDLIDQFNKRKHRIGIEIPFQTKKIKSSNTSASVSTSITGIPPNNDTTTKPNDTTNNDEDNDLLSGDNDITNVKLYSL